MQNQDECQRKTTEIKQQSVTEWFNMHFSVCWGSERASWLTGMWRRMCCNSPGGPIPPWVYTAQDAEILPWRDRSSFSRKQDKAEKPGGTCSHLSYRTTVHIWTDRIPNKRSNSHYVSLGPARTLLERQTTVDITAWIKIVCEWAKHTHTHTHELVHSLTLNQTPYNQNPYVSGDGDHLKRDIQHYRKA